MNSFISSSDTVAHRTFIRVFAMVLAVGLVVLIGGGEIIIRTRDTPPTDDMAEYRRLFYEQAAPIVALGDSHVARGLPRGDKTLLNLGWPSDNLHTVMDKLKLRQQTLPARLVIVQADPHQFSNYRLLARQEERGAALRSSFQPPLKILEHAHRQYLFQYWSSVAAGFFVEPVRLGPKEIARQVSIRVQLHTPMSNFAGTPLLADYRDLLRSLVSQGVRVCLVRFPVSKAYREMADTIPPFRNAETVLKNMALDNGWAFADYWDKASEELFHPEDPDHLNPAGAEWLRERVLGDCDWH